MDHYEAGLIIPRAHPINSLPEFIQWGLGGHVGENGVPLYPKNVFFTRDSLRSDYDEDEIRIYRERTTQAREHFGFTDKDVLWSNQYVEWSRPEDEIRSEWPKIMQTARTIAHKTRIDFIDDAIRTESLRSALSADVLKLLRFLRECIDEKDAGNPNLAGTKFKASSEWLMVYSRDCKNVNIDEKDKRESWKNQKSPLQAKKRRAPLLSG